jgi:hypothetical protein
MAPQAFEPSSQVDAACTLVNSCKPVLLAGTRCVQGRVVYAVRLCLQTQVYRDLSCKCVVREPQFAALRMVGAGPAGRSGLGFMHFHSFLEEHNTRLSSDVCCVRTGIPAVAAW